MNVLEIRELDKSFISNKNGETFRSAQDDRRKAREEYRQQRRLQLKHEASLKAELQEMFPKK